MSRLVHVIAAAAVAAGLIAAGAPAVSGAVADTWTHPPAHAVADTWTHQPKTVSWG